MNICFLHSDNQFVASKEFNNYLSEKKIASKYLSNWNNEDVIASSVVVLCDKILDEMPNVLSLSCTDIVIWKKQNTDISDVLDKLSDANIRISICDDFKSLQFVLNSAYESWRNEFICQLYDFAVEKTVKLLKKYPRLNRIEEIKDNFFINFEEVIDHAVLENDKVFFVSYVNSFLNSDLQYANSINLVQLDNLVEANTLNKCFYADIEHEGLVHIFHLKGEINNAIELKLARVLSFFSIAFKVAPKLFDQNISLEAEIFQAFLGPISVISSNSEVILHNLEFSKLSVLPKKMLQFKNDEQVDLDGKIWKIYRSDFVFQGQDVSLFILNGLDNILINSNEREFGELGIIASSIAHELKNPVAGILAAITVLKLDEWDTDTLNILNEIQDSAERCRHLISLFLGFSKKINSNLEQGHISDAIIQAQNLLRFRLVESSVNLNLKTHFVGDSFSSINLPFYTMIMYLIFNEAITSFSHLKLLENNSVPASNVLCLEVFVESSFVNVRCLQLNLEKNLKHLKLLDHLVKIERMSLEYSESVIHIALDK